MTDTETQAREESAEDAEEPFLLWALKLLSRVSFAAGCAGTLVLTLAYLWPEVNVPVYYFVVRPGFVWFGGVLPFLLAGIIGVRLRWIAPALVLWGFGLGLTGDYLPLLRFDPGDSRAAFAAARRAYRAGENSSENPSAARRPLRIITWNIEGGRAMKVSEGLEWLERLSPDLVLMQESRDHVLREALEQTSAFEGYEFAGDRQSILSRFPVSPLDTGPLDRWRGDAWKVHVSPESTVAVLNVHLSSQPLRTQLLRGWSVAQIRESIATYKIELHAVRGLVQKYSDRWPVILGGDFNLPPCYPPMRRLRSRLKDCFTAAGSGWGRTVPISFPVVRIDMIMVPRSSRVYYAAALDSDRSDHLPVIAEAAVPVHGSGAVRRPDIGPAWEGMCGVLTGCRPHGGSPVAPGRATAHVTPPSRRAD
ncbi:MAG: endonuclease/exonuclease/phosphatase family protein [Planctomycetota bacterium]